MSNDTECRYPCGCEQFPEEHCACMDGHHRQIVQREAAMLEATNLDWSKVVVREGPVSFQRGDAPSTAAFLREAADTMRANWESDEDCDPAEAEFYVAVADYLASEDTHRFGPTEHAINIARAYLGRTE